MRAAGLMWTALIILVGVSLFVLKYKVQALEDELHAKQARIERDRTAIGVLEAEWAYLNDPERLTRLSAEYLAMTPPAPSQVVKIDALPMRAPEGASPPDQAPPAGMPGEPPMATTPPVEPWRAAGLGAAGSSAIEGAATDQPAARPAHQRPSLILATVARLQRLIPPGWAGATMQGEARP